MEELHEVTRQYLSCSDPVEAAARRQRVLFSDANGLMEETAAAIMAASQGNLTVAEHRASADSNPATPPPQYECPLNLLLHPDPAVDCYTPPERREEDIGLDPYYSDVAHVQNTPVKDASNNTKIRSIIISPNLGTEIEIQNLHEEWESPNAEETLSEYQNKIRRKSSTTTKKKQGRISPKILRGASLKKMKLSQMHNSPASNAPGQSSQKPRRTRGAQR